MKLLLPILSLVAAPFSAAESEDFGCEFIMLSHPGFSNEQGEELGMNLHVRTKIDDTWYSYISEAVLQIGDSTMEIRGGEEGAEINMDNTEFVKLRKGRTFMENFPVIFRNLDDFPEEDQVTVNLRGGNSIVFETFNEFVRINMLTHDPSLLEGSAGLLGSSQVDREGIDIDNPDQVGVEWQYQEGKDPDLFTFVGPPGNAHVQECSIQAQGIRSLARKNPFDWEIYLDAPTSTRKLIEKGTMEGVLSFLNPF